MSTGEDVKRGRGTQGRWRLLGAHAVSGAGDQLFNLLVAILVYERTRSPFLLALTFALAYGGAVLGYFLMPFVGHRPPVRVLVACDLLSAAAVLLLLPGVGPLAVAGLIALGVVRAVHRPLAQAMVPLLATEPSELRRLNADFQTAGTIALGAGFALGGVFGATDLARVGLLLNAATFLASAAALAGIRPAAPAAPAGAGAGSNVRRQLGEAPRAIRGDRVLHALIVTNAPIFGLVIAVNNQLIALVLRTPGGSSVRYVIVEAVMTVAIFVAAMLLRRVRVGLLSGRVQLSVAWLGASAVTGLLYAAGALAPSYLWLLAAFAIAGATDSASVVTQTELLHASTPSSVRDKVYSARFVLRNAGKGVATLAVGALASATDVRSAVLVAGLAMALLSVAVMVRLLPSLVPKGVADGVVM